MAKVPVAQNRAQIEDDGISVRVAMRAPRNPAAMVFLTIWLGGWFFAERFGSAQLFHPGPRAPAPFLLIWLTAWTLGGAFCIFALAWQAAGREVLTLRADALVIRRALFGLGREREYDLANVKALRVGPVARAFSFGSSRTRAMEAYGLSGGPITFDYGPRTIKCGAVLDEAEATAIVERFWQRNPRLRPAPPA